MFGSLLHLGARRACRAAALRYFHRSARHDKAITFKLSDIGEGISEVELVRWNKAVGDEVEEMETVCTVQSDKAAVDITSRYTGVVKKLYVDTGKMIKIGSPLMDIEAEDDPEQAPATPAAGKSPAAKAAGAPSQPLQRPQRQSGARVSASPSVRQLAKQLGVDIEKVPPTGSMGQITREDVEKFAAASAPGSDGAGEFVKLNGVGRGMAKSMVASLEIPHVTVGEDLDLTDLRDFYRQKRAESPDTKLTMTPFLLKGMSLALSANPIMNSKFTGDGYMQYSEHHINVAVATDRGLLVPVIRNVERKSIRELQEDLSRVQKLSAELRLAPEDITGGTATLSNLGAIGGTYVNARLFGGQGTIVALGAARRRPCYVGDELVPRDQAALAPRLRHLERAHQRPQVLVELLRRRAHHRDVPLVVQQLAREPRRPRRLLRPRPAVRRLLRLALLQELQHLRREHAAERQRAAHARPRHLVLEQALLRHLLHELLVPRHEEAEGLLRPRALQVALVGLQQQREVPLRRLDGALVGQVAAEEEHALDADEGEVEPQLRAGRQRQPLPLHVRQPDARQRVLRLLELQQEPEDRLVPAQDRVAEEYAQRPLHPEAQPRPPRDVPVAPRAQHRRAPLLELQRVPVPVRVPPERRLRHRLLEVQRDPPLQRVGVQVGQQVGHVVRARQQEEPVRRLQQLHQPAPRHDVLHQRVRRRLVHRRNGPLELLQRGELQRQRIRRRLRARPRQDPHVVARLQHRRRHVLDDLRHPGPVDPTLLPRRPLGHHEELVARVVQLPEVDPRVHQAAVGVHRLLHQLVRQPPPGVPRPEQLAGRRQLVDQRRPRDPSGARERHQDLERADGRLHVQLEPLQPHARLPLRLVELRDPALQLLQQHVQHLAEAQRHEPSLVRLHEVLAPSVSDHRRFLALQLTRVDDVASPHLVRARLDLVQRSLRAAEHVDHVLQHQLLLHAGRVALPVPPQLQLQRVRPAPRDVQQRDERREVRAGARRCVGVLRLHAALVELAVHPRPAAHRPQTAKLNEVRHFTTLYPAGSAGPPELAAVRERLEKCQAGEVPPRPRHSALEALLHVLRLLEVLVVRDVRHHVAHEAERDVAVEREDHRVHRDPEDHVAGVPEPVEAAAVIGAPEVDVERVEVVEEDDADAAEPAVVRPRRLHHVARQTYGFDAEPAHGAQHRLRVPERAARLPLRRHLRVQRVHLRLQYLRLLPAHLQSLRQPVLVGLPVRVQRLAEVLVEVVPDQPGSPPVGVAVDPVHFVVEHPLLLLQQLQLRLKRPRRLRRVLHHVALKVARHPVRLRRHGVAARPARVLQERVQPQPQRAYPRDHPHLDRRLLPRRLELHQRVVSVEQQQTGDPHEPVVHGVHAPKRQHAAGQRVLPPPHREQRVLQELPLHQAYAQRGLLAARRRHRLGLEEPDGAVLAHEAQRVVVLVPAVARVVQHRVAEVVPVRQVRAAAHQPLHDAVRPPPARQQQRGPPLPVLLLQRYSREVQELQNVQRRLDLLAHDLRRRHEERRQPLAVLVAEDLRAVPRHQQLHHLDVAAPDGEVYGRLQVDVFRPVRVAPGAQQAVHQLGLARLARCEPCDAPSVHLPQCSAHSESRLAVSFASSSGDRIL
ncbi:dihydrolipoamide branched chain transacylase, E2 subunit, putative [Babesia caballi]|uniref:Lipoamide acyltransferase component of branched-chain alpha-keto acid dehydrogenase complex, mitochondrial n=1 Tax=Babesia caballi TaxID=5871 RepID=A0AAV4M343_BABCB|nr:dihydrolipoamide branched chain transacylase, E2 subunit, putative [Babesia caballi]